MNLQLTVYQSLICQLNQVEQCFVAQESVFKTQASYWLAPVSQSEKDSVINVTVDQFQIVEAAIEIQLFK